MVKKKRDSIVVFGAHSDDFVIGAGGTIAKYVQEGKDVVSIVFSYGEMSHPWLKEKVVRKMRTKEALEASKILGCKTYIYDLKEGHFMDGYHKNDLKKEILSRVNKVKPNKIFTHSVEDPHPDHKSAHQITMDIYEEVKSKFNPEIYVYSVWNPISLKTDWPSLYMNITKTFGLKLKALKCFRSQKIHVAYPFFLLLFRTIKEGLKIKKLFGEMFYRIK